MGAITDAFLAYAKHGAGKFTDLFGFEIVNAGKTDGLKWHLQEIRQKTYDAVKGLEDGKVDKVKNENSTRTVIRAGQKYLGDGLNTGVIKIKHPTRDAGMFGYFVDLYAYSDITKNISLYIFGYKDSAGFGSGASPISCGARIESGSNDYLPLITFCTGAAEDYILIGSINDTRNFGRVVVRTVANHFTSADWSTGWDISFLTSLEALENTKKFSTKPSLNATSLNGAIESTNGTANTIFKWSDIANTIKTFFKIKISSTSAFDVSNDVGTSALAVDTISNKIIYSNVAYKQTVSGTVGDVPHNVWTVLIPLPKGISTIRCVPSTVGYDTVYANLFRVSRIDTNGTQVSITTDLYNFSGSGALARLRVNGTNIEVLQTSGAVQTMKYILEIENV